MKNYFISAVLAAQLLTQLHAGGDLKEVEPAVTEVEDIAEVSDLYIVGKGMMVFGDDITEGEAALSGDRGYGFGIDLGYRIGDGFAIECDYSYSKNTVTERKLAVDPESYKVNYQTLGLDLVYTYEATENLGIFGKAGYEYEWENISARNAHGYDYGMVIGAGFEYKLSESYRFVAEYEHSSIKSTRGDDLFAGIMYNF